MTMPIEGFEYMLWMIETIEQQQNKDKKRMNMSKEQNVWKNGLNPQTLKPRIFCIFVLNDLNGLSTWILQSLFEKIELCSRILSSNMCLVKLNVYYSKLNIVFKHHIFLKKLSILSSLHGIRCAIRGPQYIFELQTQPNYIPRILNYLIIKCLKVSLSTL